jgi:glycosyltransferase involved in cell wall biosynthesis
VNIAIVAPLVSAIREPQAGGSQAFVSELAKGLVRRGHDVNLYAASGSEVGGVEVIDIGVDHRDLRATLYRHTGRDANRCAPATEAFARVYTSVRDVGYDVVHNHAFDAPAVTLASDLGAPVVHTVHLPPEREVVEALRTAICRDPAPMVACVSKSQANSWRRVVPVGAILSPYIPTSKIPFSATGGSGAVFAGRLSAEKGAAEAIVISRIAGVTIDVFGDRYDADYAREHVDPRSTEPGVFVHPGVPQTQLWEAMARAAVVLCPSKWEEPFGMVAAEAQACGTPVVAFRRGAIDEVVVDGLTGLLVEPGDLGAAAEAVKAAKDLSRRACRQHAERHLDIENTLDAHERLYERLAEATQRTRARG